MKCPYCKQEIYVDDEPPVDSMVGKPGQSCEAHNLKNGGSNPPHAMEWLK